MKYYLGLDNGGTNTKAALFTEDGAQIAVESVATAALTPAPGFVERDMEEMWQDNCAVVRRLLERVIEVDRRLNRRLAGDASFYGKDGR